MTTEIELKFSINETTIAALATFLSQWPSTYKGKRSLLNVYYDTDDDFLRSRQAGLRIRSEGNEHEMTLKIGGKAVAGLHQRPEYNIALAEPRLNLSLFPHDVWPEECDISRLEERLKPLFSTDFTREIWLINYEESEIELALDRGRVAANGDSMPLSEVELELKQGDVSAILTFAQRLCQIGGMRLSSQSKAARGYRLARGSAGAALEARAILSVAEKLTVEQGLQQAIELALSNWQSGEELWIAGNKRAKPVILDALATLRQVWIVWGGIIPRKATSPLRDKLRQVEDMLSDDERGADEVCSKPLYTQTKLAFSHWYIDKQWVPFLDDKDRAKLAGSFKRFADIQLSRTLRALKDMYAHRLNEREYSDRQTALNKQIVSFYLLSGAYPEETVHHYVESWQSAHSYIAQQNYVEGAKRINQALSQPIFWLSGSQPRRPKG